MPIWEGTSSVNSLDVLRAINKSRGAALMVLQTRIERISAGADSQVMNTLLKQFAIFRTIESMYF